MVARLSAIQFQRDKADSLRVELQVGVPQVAAAADKVHAGGERCRRAPHSNLALTALERDPAFLREGAKLRDQGMVWSFFRDLLDPLDHRSGVFVSRADFVE